MVRVLAAVRKPRYIRVMNYVPQIPDWFLTRKAAQVVAYFAARAGGRINILKATKLLYLSDRESMAQRDHPITNDSYVSMPFGPVNSCAYNYMNGAAPVRQEDWLEFIGPRSKNDLIASQSIDIPADLDELSRGDIRIMSEIWENFEDTDRFDLAEWTHKFCPEWRNPGKSSIPIDLATIFRKLEKDDPIGLAEDLQAERRFVAERLAQNDV